MIEAWRPVAGYVGLYDISDHGRARSLARTVIRANGRPMPVPERILKPFWRNGYLCVNLHRDDEMVTVQVHTLVLEHFVGPRPEGMVACHFPNGSEDNSLRNLRWDTYSENEKDKRRAA